MHETLGERIRKRRESLHWSVEQSARYLQAPVRYMQGLENDDYDVFPAKIYALGFLKKFMTATNFPERESFLKEFNAEWEVRTYKKKQEIRTRPLLKGDGVYLTPQRLGMILGLGALLLITLVLGARLTALISSPPLALEEPRDRAVLSEPLARVRGRTEKESQLTVNGREITIDGSGNFDEKVELAMGLNVLEFLTKDRFGKESKAVRYVLVK